uniref:NADH-ubiquinone oxidoreductase chain 5 n=1 Tax=Achalinus meiguensis TaxID=572522 RepID=B6ZC08_ACHME|nr:NADH dehydrogenase subunit 5 [Achalinus meiguensis]ACJ14786.1 NADH dehydrogenase subunit 5 [Achalinus meiguensis]
MNLIAPTITMTIFISLFLSATFSTKNSAIKNNLLVMFLVSLIPLISLKDTDTTTLSLQPFITTTENIHISITLDSLSVTFAPIALFITWSIIEFSTWYMSADPKTNKFVKFLLIFLISMLTITTANNMYQLFIGWEGVGIMSFLLIGWWSARPDANTAAMQAIIYNRIGDIGLIITTVWLLSLSSINFQELLQQKMSALPMIGLIAAAMGKSAQFFLHPWLPSAMEGPTPVSALLHSSTMVVAGIFLLIRLHPILDNKAMTICLIIGATTTMFAATSATTQHDIKKIVALSTTSQLGLMMTMVGLDHPTLAFLHMMTHSFFKALLFLCSGTFIHSLNNEQDIRMMGGLHTTLPLSSTFITIASLSLMGTPFLSGFYSKDTILETMSNSHTNSWALLTTLAATLLSSIYSMRIITFTLTHYPRTKHWAHQETKTVVPTLLRLTSASIFTGALTKLSAMQTTTTVTMPTTIKLAALLITLLGITLSMDFINLITTPKTKTLKVFFNQLAFYNTPHRSAMMKMLKLSKKTSTELIDLWTLENLGPKSITHTTITTVVTTTQQKSLIKNYLTTFTMSILILLTLTP